MESQHWFASCPRGLESLLLDELHQLGAATARETVAGCSFEGALSVAYRVSLWSRLANRVLLSLGEYAANDPAELLQSLQDLAFEDYLVEGGSCMVVFTGKSASFRNTQYGAQCVKDAIVDRFRARGLKRPGVDRKNPDQRFHARLHRGQLAVSLDFAGASLHQRGYRTESGRAPLKENLAAAILLRADWPGIAARGGALIDPLCGSGTLLIEGAMMAADIAPGLLRQRWAFEKLPQHNPAQWQAIHREAQARAARGKDLQLPEIRGYDASRSVVDKALANIRCAGLERAVRVSCKPLAALKRPSHRAIHTGLVASNPPYGERLGEVESLRSLYREWGDGVMREFPGWQAAMLTSEKELGMATGLRSQRRYTLYNGALACTLLLFRLEEDQRLPERRQPSVAVADAFELGPGAQMFANRIRKNIRQLDQWARGQGHSCYRVYDADMPEYAVAVDRYGEMLHVAEYRAPRHVDAEAAERRMEEIRQALPVATGVPSERIFYKQRERQRGAAQYEPTGDQGELTEVTEGQVRLLVNLSAYLDTGLFLDHRPLRLRIAQEAQGGDFLNLFCYTASASVHAAAGGARSTVSVDLSNTYLDWARRNLVLNDFGTPAHELVRADCLDWLASGERQFDLILLDPPSFSNSARMERALDVQRDHVELIELCQARLRAGGTLYFSNNLRSFRLDPSLRDSGLFEDISAATIDRDFKRNARIHGCWRYQKK
jgi:23S rRNA (guanine2445-N2)-methyltransferase / 23S rRNA (guanine2069-N7)-methyltransferase